jgi:2-dehydropantoate 2-reductase
MNILIIGAGAIGCLAGGKLALSGQNVTLAGRPRFAEMVRTQGLVLADAAGTHLVTNVRAAGGIAEALAQATDLYDLAIFTVKSYDTEAALAELQTAASTAGFEFPAILSLQNGVGNEEAIGRVMGEARVIAGTITTPVSVRAPGVIYIERPTHTIGLSAWCGSGLQPFVVGVRDTFQQAGFATRIYANAQGMKWTKLLMNIVGNATSAILDEPPAQVFADPALVDLEIAAWREALAVMRRAGIPPLNLGKYPFRVLAPLIRSLPNGLLRPLLRRQVAGGRGGKMPSLQIDLSSGKTQSEVCWLNGAVAGHGRRWQVPTPVNRQLAEILLGLARNPAERAGWRHNHERLRQLLS